MTDRKEIIDHLQVIRRWAVVGEGREGIIQRCCGDVKRWVGEALKVLEAETPRLLTIKDLKSLPRRAVVWEEYREGNHVWDIMRPMIRSCYTATLIDEDGEIDITDDLLQAKNGKQRRLWSAKPSKEQRKAVAWDD